MKFLPSKRFKVNPKDPEVIARSKQPHVKELAASIKALGGEPAHQPVLTAAGAFVAGRDRHAAMSLLGAKTFEARVVEGTELEIEALCLSENLHRRRDDRDALIARFVAVTERMLATNLPPAAPNEGLDARSSSSATPVAPIQGRPQTPRGKAREQVAAALGIKAESVRAAEHREAKKAAPKVPESSQDATSLGAEVDGYNDDLQAILKLLKAAKFMARHIGEHPTLPTAAFDRIVQELDNLKFMVEACRIVARCPACIGGVAKGPYPCTLCSGFNLVTQFQLSGYVVEPKPIEHLGAVVASDDELEPVDDTEAF